MQRVTRMRSLAAFNRNMRWSSHGAKSKNSRWKFTAPQNVQSYPCIVVNAASELRRESVRLTDIGVKVHPRDLLALDIDSGSQKNSSKSMYNGNTRRTYVCLPRKDFFLVSFGNIKAIVVKGAIPRMIVFEPHKPAIEEFGENMVEAIPNFTFCASGRDEEPSFELGVMEEILKEACMIFDRRIRLLKPLVQNLIKDEEDAFEDLAIKLQKLGPLEDAIQVYEMEVKEARQCILRLLQNDEDMHALVSTMDPSKIDLANLNENQMTTIASVELLLESYIHKINRNYDTLIYFRQKLNTWKSMTSMSMQMKRNKIMNYNLHMAIAAVSIGTCSACAGIFGMNLTSGLENSPWAFFVASSGMMGIAGLFQYSMSRTLFGRDLNLKLRKQASRIQGMKTILIERADSLDDAIKVVFDVLDNTGKYKDAIPAEMNEDGTESTLISKEAFSNIFVEQDALVGQKSTLKSRKDKDFHKNVGQLFELLDVDKNKFLDREELSASSGGGDK
jgi:hypothetical protein